MGSSPSSPPPPDPMDTAKAQAQMNSQTAITQFGLNATNQITPYGALTYKQIGEWPDGTPRFQATQTLTQPQQHILNTNQKTQGRLANIGFQQTNKIGRLLSTPFSLGNEETEARLMDLGMRRLAPQFAQDEEALRTRLANQGIQIGSAAYKDAMGGFGETKNDAITQLLLRGRSQATNELLTERNQPLNEITALMSGSQVQQPNFVNTPDTKVAGVDYMGAVQNQYAAQMQAYQAQMQQKNAMMGGLFGLGGSLLQFSDERLKTDITRVGELPNGLPVYTFRYKWGGPVQLGLMARDVEKVKPDAVSSLAGYLAVDYAKALEA